MSERALTVGEIARRLNCPIHRIEYLVQSRNIQPTQRAGNLRVFSQETYAFIEAELKKSQRSAKKRGKTEC